MLNLLWTQLGVTTIPLTQDVISPEEASLVFSGPQFLVALVAGVMMAFAFQLLLTNFSVAFGISSWGIDEESDNLGGTVRNIAVGVGLSTILTVSIALFIACYLAVKLSLVESTLLGAIVGIVIWSTYFSLLVWVGSTTVGSLVGSVVSTATSGFQGIMGTATAALGANAARQQAVSTAEEITAVIRRELTSGLNPESIRETLQSSLGSVQLPQLNLKDIRGQFENLLRNSDLKSIADSDLLNNVNRETFVNLVSSRTDLSKSDINRIADQLEGAWKQVVGQTQKQDPQSAFLNILQSATPEELNSNQLVAKLEQLISDQPNQQEQQSSGLVNQAMQFGFDALVATVLPRVDFSKLDVDKISAQLQKLKDKAPNLDVEKISNLLQTLKDRATEQANKLGHQVSDKLLPLQSNTIRADVDNYLLKSYPWHLNRETIKTEFKDVIYDPEASPGTVRGQLEQLNRDYFIQKLRQRADLLPEKVTEVADQIEEIRMDFLSKVQSAESQEQSQNLRSRLENYLRSTGKEELNPESIQQEFKTLLEDPEAGVEKLRERLSQFDRDTLMQLLKQRQDISEEEANQIISQFEETRDSVLNSAQELQEKAKSQAEELRNKVEAYLRDTNLEELNPEGIKRDFQTLFDNPEAGISVLRSRLSQFDRETLVKLLSQRQDISEEQVNQVIDAIQSVRDNILQTPRKLAGRAQEQYEKTTSALAEYLRNTNLEELNPEGIQRDLAKLLDDPREGALALRDRLSQVDRETLVKLLTQRGDLSEEQINRAIERVQEAINNVVKAPRRFANRTVKQVQDFEENLESYLRNTNKEELNPEGIKRDLQLLLSSPGAGLGNWGERLSKFDRSTLVALLVQREDISEEEANQIADQIVSVRDSVVEQVQKVQQRIQSLIDGTFDRIRNYLNSLERPELNYEGIKQDFAKLFDDPQTGLEALQSRLSQFDRDTLVAILSSREDISQEDANRIIAQIEGARDSVLKRAELIQQETQKRLEAVKQQTVKQAQETKKAVAGAAWWLFTTAVSSLAASAIAGAIAVRGIAFIS